MPCKGYLTPSSFQALTSGWREGMDHFTPTSEKIVDKLAAELLGWEQEEENEITPIACQWGKENEWLAVETYQERTLRQVNYPVEFRASKSHGYVGGTMDGLIGGRGGVEIKSPYNSMEHLANLERAKQLSIYQYQIQGYLWIYELDWIDFVSFDPRFPEPYQLAVRRVFPQRELIERLQARCEAAYRKALEKVRMIQEVYETC